MDSADLLERNIRTMLEAQLRKEREEAAIQLEEALANRILAPEQEVSVIGAYLTRFHDPSEAIRLRVIELVRNHFANLNCLDMVLPRVIHEIHSILACSPVNEHEKSEVVRLLLLKLLLRVIHTCNEDNLPLVEGLSLFFNEILEILTSQMKEKAPENRILINKCLFKLTKTYQKRSHLLDKDLVRNITVSLLENYRHTMYTVRMTTIDVLCSLHLSPASEDIAILVSPYVSLFVTDSNINVRRSVAVMAATLLNEHIDRHVYLDFFCGILLSLALDKELHAEVFTLFAECGEIYEREHKDDLRLSKELNSPPIISNYNKFLERVAPRNYLVNVTRLISGEEYIESALPSHKLLRLSLGCRCLAERTIVKIIKAVLADIAGSNDIYRLKSCDMLAMLLIINEHNNIRYSPIILEQVISLYVSDKVRTDFKDQLTRILDLIFSFLLPREIVCFMLNFYRRSQLSTKQLGGILTLIEQFIRIRTSFLQEDIRYLEPAHDLTPGYLVRFINEIILKEDVIYSDDTYVHNCFKGCIYAIVKYIILFSKNSTCEGFTKILQEEGDGKDISDVPSLLSKLTICIISAESKLFSDNIIATALDAPYNINRTSNSAPRHKLQTTVLNTDISKYESQSITELLQAILGLQGTDNQAISTYFSKCFELIDLDTTTHNLEKRMNFFMRMMISFIAAGYQLPSEVENTMRSLFIQLMRLTNKANYSTSIRLTACRCLYLVLSCLTRTLTMSNANMRYFFIQILQISTWQFGARTPECLEYLLRALALMISAFTTESFELICKSQNDAFGIILGRVVSNLEGDTPGCRIAALDMLRGLYKYVDYVRTLELLYSLVQRVNDCVSLISTDALQLCGEILTFHYTKNASGATDTISPSISPGEKLIITNRELLKLLVLHVDDSVITISASCVELLKQIWGICTPLTCYNVKQLIEERLERCSRKVLYKDLWQLYENVEPPIETSREEMMLTSEYEKEVTMRTEEQQREMNKVGSLAGPTLTSNEK